MSIEIDGKLWLLKDWAYYCPDCNCRMTVADIEPYKEFEKKLILICTNCLNRKVFWWWEWLDEEPESNPFEPAASVEPKGETPKP